MVQGLPLVITINRQLGSGGAFLGRQLAEKLKMLYLDREIINKVAEELGTLPENLEWRDERIISKWQAIINSIGYSQSVLYSPAEYIMPSDKEIFKAESDIILKIANERSAVIIGRGSSYILQNHPNHVSIYLHANVEFRKQRVQEIYGVSSEDAIKSMESSDKFRARYIHELTGLEMNDARQYHLSIDTGVLGLEKAENLIYDYLRTRFGNVDSIIKN
ncbi:cytidylate kinase-like family protein [Fusibacter bizertensis]